MGLVLNIQLSVFCNCRIEPNSENISKLMGEINKLNKMEFLPNIISGQTINLAAGKVEVVSNLSFVTADQSGQIICRDERIDCVLNFGTDKQSSLEENIEFAQKVIMLIMKNYSILSNRLAINVNLLSEEYKGEIQDTNFGQRIVSLLDFYHDKELKEWSLRNNVWYPINIVEKDENVNVITELSIVRSNPGDKKRILCHMDINTVPENTGYRFGYESFKKFVNETQKIVVTIQTNFEELSNNAD